MQQAQGGIEVRAEFFPLAFLLFLCRPRVVIDGYAYDQGWWNPRFYPLAPGWHRVKVFFVYLFWPECGANTVDVLVQPGEVLRVNFYMPPLMLLKGSLTVGPTRTPAAVPAQRFPPAPSAPPAAGPTSGPCARCGAPLRPGLRFCEQCGAPRG
jgi:hypothetical protein